MKTVFISITKLILVICLFIAMLMVWEAKSTPKHKKALIVATNKVIVVLNILIVKSNTIKLKINRVTNMALCDIVGKIEPIKMGFEITNSRSREAYSAFLRKPKVTEEVVKKDEGCVFTDFEDEVCVESEKIKIKLL